MKVRSFALVWSIVLFPLNTFTSFGNNFDNATLNNRTIDISANQEFLFDIEEIKSEEKIDSIPVEENALNSLIQQFKYISPEAIKMTLNSYNYLLESNKISKPNIITIVDFSKPSTTERLFVIDLKNRKLIQKSLCAHGKNSGENYAQYFSNNNQSYQSSLGAYVASETYDGSKGYSLKLDGQESGINSNARERGVVIHAADYVSFDFIQAHGRLGRSQGCPALPFDKYEKIIQTIKGGSCFFIYHPNAQYKQSSNINKSFDELALNSLLTNSN